METWPWLRVTEYQFRKTRGAGGGGGGGGGGIKAETLGIQSEGKHFVRPDLDQTVCKGRKSDATRTIKDAEIFDSVKYCTMFPF